jgi:exosortase K
LSALVLVAAFALKRFYSHAGASELEWILTPSCWLAGLSGLELEHEAGAGFISHGSRMVVGAACAGVNFLIAAWLALFFCCQGHLNGTARKLAWSAQSLLFAYALTVATNGLRIVLAAHFFGAELHAGWLTPARLHRLLGVVLYCGALLASCGAATRWFAPQNRGPLATLSPFLWYLAVVVGVPLANRAWAHEPARFVEHVAFTSCAGALVWLLARIASALLDRLCSRSANP